jgi:hypothetical protein
LRVPLLSGRKAAGTPGGVRTMKTQSPAAPRKLNFVASPGRFTLEPVLFQIVQKSVLLLLVLCVLIAVGQAVFPGAIFPF